MNPEGEFGMNKLAYDTHKDFLLIIPEFMLTRMRWNFISEYFFFYFNVENVFVCVSSLFSDKISTDWIHEVHAVWLHTDESKSFCWHWVTGLLMLRDFHPISKISEYVRVQHWCHVSRRNKTKISVSLCLCFLHLLCHLLHLHCLRCCWLACSSFINRQDCTDLPMVASHVLYLILAGHLHEKCAKLPVCFRHDGLLTTHFAKLGVFEPGWTQKQITLLHFNKQKRHYRWIMSWSTMIPRKNLSLLVMRVSMVREQFYPISCQMGVRNQLPMLDAFGSWKKLQTAKIRKD